MSETGLRVDAGLGNAGARSSQGGVVVDECPAPPREVLPPCWSVIVFDGRHAVWWRAEPCGHQDFEWRHEMCAGKTVDFYQPDSHPEIDFTVPGLSPHECMVHVRTNDDAVARAGWEVAEHWVRTGSLREGSTSDV